MKPAHAITDRAKRYRAIKPEPLSLPDLSFHINLAVSIEEMRAWAPARISRYFQGIAQILQAAKGVK